MPIVSNWLMEIKSDNNVDPQPRTNTSKRLKQDEWMSLPSDDLRFKFSQKEKGQDLYDILQSSNLIFDTQTWLQSM